MENAAETNYCESVAANFELLHPLILLWYEEEGGGMNGDRWRIRRNEWRFKMGLKPRGEKFTFLSQSRRREEEEGEEKWDPGDSERN